MFKPFAFVAITIAISAFGTYALAAAKPGDVNVDNTGIVTPDIATGFMEFETYTYQTDGVLVVCKAPAERERGGACMYQGKLSWTPVHLAIPAGRKYVGFRVVSRSYGYRQLEVYWK